MGKWGWRGQVVVCAVALGACSGGGEGASADAPSTTVEVTTTTAVAAITTTTVVAATTTTVPPPYSFDGSVPPPPLHNTGEDFEAIVRSLDAYLLWIVAHRPELSLIANVAVEGSNQHQTYVDDVDGLLANQARVYDENGGIASAVEITDRSEGFVTLRVAYDDDRRILVSSTGEILDAKENPAHQLAVLLATDAAGRWRLVSVTLASTHDAEVTL